MCPDSVDVDSPTMRTGSLESRNSLDSRYSSDRGARSVSGILALSQWILAPRQFPPLPTPNFTGIFHGGLFKIHLSWCGVKIHRERARCRSLVAHRYIDNKLRGT